MEYPYLLFGFLGGDEWEAAFCTWGKNRRDWEEVGGGGSHSSSGWAEARGDAEQSERWDCCTIWSVFPAGGQEGSNYLKFLEV